MLTWTSQKGCAFTWSTGMQLSHLQSIPEILSQYLYPVCVVFSAFPWQGQGVSRRFCPWAAAGFPAAEAVNPEAVSQLHGEGSGSGVPELLHGSSREGICGLNFRELVGPNSVLSHPIKNKHRAIDGPCSAPADFYRPWLGLGMERVLGWSHS